MAKSGPGVDEEVEIPEVISVLPIRDRVLFPGTVIAIDEARKSRLDLIEAVIAKKLTVIGIVTQRDEKNDEVGFSDLYSVGCAARVLKTIRLTRVTYSLIVQGVCRIRLLKEQAGKPFLTVRVKPMPDGEAEAGEVHPFVETVKDLTRRALKVMPNLPRDTVTQFESLTAPGQLADFVTSFLDLDLSVEKKQEILEIIDPIFRLQSVHHLLTTRAAVKPMEKATAAKPMEKAADPSDPAPPNPLQKVKGLGTPEPTPEPEWQSELDGVVAVLKDPSEISPSPAHRDLVSATPWTLRFISGKYQGGEFPLRLGAEMVIGRSSELDMVLVEDMVSRKHAKISVTNDEVTIEDLQSTIGTFVNGEKIRKATLRDGDRVLIGTSIMKLLRTDGAASPLETDARERLAALANQRRPRSSMTGSIEEIPLSNLLKTLSNGKKSGVLVLRSDVGIAKVYLRKGQIYFASIDFASLKEAPDLAPREAIRLMLTWTKGSFELEPPDDRKVQEELQESTDVLLGLAPPDAEARRPGPPDETPHTDPPQPESVPEEVPEEVSDEETDPNHDGQASSAPAIVIEVKVAEDGDLLSREIDLAEWVRSAKPDVSLLTAVSELQQSRAMPLELLKALGAYLFRIAFPSDALRDRLGRHLDGPSSSEPLRIVMVLRQPDRASGLDPSALPWEAMYDPKREIYLGLDGRLVLKRRRADVPILPPPATGSTLHIAACIAVPGTAEGGALHTETARRMFARYDGDGGIVFHVVSPLLEGNLLSAIAPPTAVFHFHGHGQSGYLLLEKEGAGSNSGWDGAAAVDVSKVAHAFSTATLGLAVLASCKGTHRTEPEALSIAEALLRAGVPAVVAMQGEIYDDAANRFAEALYLGIAKGLSVDRAVQHARLQLFTVAQSEVVDCFLPVFYERVEIPFSLANASASEPRRRVEEAYGTIERHLVAATTRLAIYGKLSSAHVRAFPKGSSVVRLLDVLTPRVSQRLAESTGRDENSAWSYAAVPDDLLQAELKEAAAEQPATEGFADGADDLRELVKILKVQAAGSNGTALHAPAAPAPAPTPPRPRPRVLPRFPLPTAGDVPLALPSGRSLDGVVEDLCVDLVIDAEMVRRALLHLLAGRHLILSGPPGTGKTTLARRLAATLGYELRESTANPDWTTFDLLGGLFPRGIRGLDGRVELTYEIRHGHLVESTLRNWSWNETRWRRMSPAGGTSKGCWLLIDELNRAPMDRAFGDLFTALEKWMLWVPHIPDDDSDATTVAVPIPKDFRLIGTVNTFDKRLLFELSDALKRRFAFVHVGVYVGGDPRKDLLAQVRARAAVEGLRTDVDAVFDRAYGRLQPIVTRIRLLRDLGTAQVIDVLCYCVVADAVAGLDVGEAVDQALTDQILPQLEGMSAFELNLLAALIEGAGLAREVIGLLRPLSDRLSADAGRIRAAKTAVRFVVENVGLDGPWRPLDALLGLKGDGESSDLEPLIDELAKSGVDPAAVGVSAFSRALRAMARERADS